LTQRHKREAKGASSFPAVERAQRPQRLCRGCGKSIRPENTHCGRCAIEGATRRLIDAARAGREASQRPEARAKHSATRRRHARACSAWDPSSRPTWLTAEVFSEKVQPLLADLSSSTIASRITILAPFNPPICGVRATSRPHVLPQILYSKKSR